MLCQRGYHTCLLLTCICGLVVATVPAVCAADSNRVQPYASNPYYWQYRGQPVLLLGGSADDNLFQIPDLQQHLDALQRAGGNYVRNTMSDRVDQGFEVRAYKKLPNGTYDLGQWNDEYWQRFRNLLAWCRQREIIVQIEVWDRFDYSRQPWETSPYNPRQNVNYSWLATGLRYVYADHPYLNKQPFFFTVPELKDNKPVLAYQQAFVDKMLSISLDFNNVLYCMDNETCGAAEWSRYWSQYIRRQAARAGVSVETTEMWDEWDVTTAMHRRTYDHPGLYSFVDISQNSQTPGQQNWDHAQWVRKHLDPQPRPINSTKIYGSDQTSESWRKRGMVTRHALESFWRNMLGGLAASRFHRPPIGLGLSHEAQVHIKSMRMLTAELDVFRCTPDGDSRTLTGRNPNEAYLTRIPGRQYAVYFPQGGSVGLDLSTVDAWFTAQWLDIGNSAWQPARQVRGGRVVPLAPPDANHWVVLLQRAE